MPPGSDRTRLYLVLVVLLWAVVYIPTLFSPALLDDADSVHAEAAREILVRGDWVTLHANGIRYLEKAPLIYWGMATSFKLFGVGEWQARLPISLGMFGAMLAVFALGRRYYSPRAGFWAAAVLGTGFGGFIYTRITIPDIHVGMFLALNCLFFLCTLEEEHSSRWACWGLAATAALNVLTKGLIGIVFPLAIIGLYLVLTRNLAHLKRMRLFSSAIVFLVIAAPWHVLASLRTPDMMGTDAHLHRGFFWFYFINEHVLRYLGLREPKDYDKVPLLLFWGLLLLWMLPWSAFLPQALAQFRLLPADQRQRATLLFAIWAFVVVGFFTFSTRQEYYVLPALPALALLVANWMDREPGELALQRAGRISTAVFALIGVAALVITLGLAREASTPPPGTDIADLLKKNPQMYALSFGHFFDLTPQALGAFRTPLLVTGFALCLGSITAWWFRKKQLFTASNAVLLAMAVVLLFCTHAGLRMFSPVLTSKPLADAIAREYRPGDHIVINGEYEEGSTLNFYTHQQVEILNGRRANLWYGSYFPDAPKIFCDDASFAQLWNSSERVYLWTEEDRVPEVAKNGSEVARSGGKKILSNRRP